jgi:integrase
MRELVDDGVDPIDNRQKDRRATRLAAAKILTFKECSEAYIAAHRNDWRNVKHAAQWSSTLVGYAFPIIGELSVADINTGLIEKVLKQPIGEDLEPLWDARSETAKRLRGRIERVLDYAEAKQARSGDNPARWQGNLKILLGKPQGRKRHHPALPYNRLGEFLHDVRIRPGVSARALEFTILTGVRTNETVEATRGEFDFQQKIWTIPGDRMKGKREHRVPLSERAIELIRERQGIAADEFMFPGGKHGEPLSNMAMAEVVKQINAEREEQKLPLYTDPKQQNRPITVHGFRSTFRVWAGEESNFPREVIEQALAHALKDETEAAYMRSDLFAKRRRLMKAWSEHCGRDASPEIGNVTKLARAS